MSALDTGLVVVVVLLAVTVVALVRAQAATTRRLDVVERRLLRAQRRETDTRTVPTTSQEAPMDQTTAPTPTGDDELVEDVVDLRGVSVGGEPAEIPLAGLTRPTLVAFFSTTCGICRSLWTTLGEEGLESVDAVVVTKDPAVEEVDVARELAGRSDLRVLMSSEAWDDYEVPGSPYFLVVDGDQVVAEGEASSWERVQALARGAA